MLTVVSCSVYDASLLGPLDPGRGGTGSVAGHSGASGEGNIGDGLGGASGKPAVNGGSSGSGDAGMLEAAGAMEAGGQAADGGTAGTGGSNGGGAGGPGSGGSAGNGTAGGGTAGGGAAGSGTAGSGGSPPASGCAKLSVPLDDANDRAHFVISLTSPADMTAAIISMHVYVQAGVGGTLFNYVQDSQYHFFGVTTPKRPELSSLSGWSTLSFDVGAQPDSAGTGIVKTNITRIGIEINSAPSTTWSNPTIVYVDSITVTTPTLSFTLDTTSSVSPTASGTDVAGQVLWLNNQTSDTKATGVTLGWQATCP